MLRRLALTVGLAVCWIAAVVGVTAAFGRAILEAWR
jgi:hypothetical protein